MQVRPNYWRFLMECFLWSTGGGWGLLGRIALVIGLGLGVFQYALPNLTIAPSTNGLVRGVVPLAVCASILIIRFFIVPYFLWRNARQEVVSLEESLKPELRAQYDVARFPGCKRDNEDEATTWHQEVFRLAVENVGITPVQGCRGILTEITFADDPEPVFSGNNWDLAFAPNDSPDAANNTIHKGTPEYLDVLFLEFRHRGRVDVFMGTANRIWPNHFPLDGEINMVNHGFPLFVSL
jgi:hypothetical protein